MQQGKRESSKIITSMDTNPRNKVPAAADMELATAIQELMPWKEVKSKKKVTTNASDVKNTDTEMEIEIVNMKKVKVTFAIRVQKDTTSFSPAKIHVDALHEMHKFNESLIVFNHDGDQTINIKAPLTDSKYKEFFKPVEKRVGRGTSWISILHEICTTSKAAECKFLYINPKPDLEQFSAIGVLLVLIRTSRGETN
jgi:hypothetical protein